MKTVAKIYLPYTNSRWAYLAVAIIEMAIRDMRYPCQLALDEVCETCARWVGATCEFELEGLAERGRKNRRRNCPGRRDGLRRKLRLFFNSDWFEMLCDGCNVDPAYLRDKAQVATLLNDTD